MPQLSIAKGEELTGSAEQAANNMVEAQQDNFNSHTYILITVLLSLVLFSSGLVPKLVSFTARSILLRVGAVVSSARSSASAISLAPHRTRRGLFPESKATERP
jgi:hypothetical protein